MEVDPRKLIREPDGRITLCQLPGDLADRGGPYRETLEEAEARVEWQQRRAAERRRRWWNRLLAFLRGR